VTWCSSPYEATEGADVMTILTEWNEFRGLDMGRLKATMKRRLIVDLRNIYSPAEMAAHGIDYISVGRPSALRRDA
jgi:UDPglucose 6-dehydrogenase